MTILPGVISKGDLAIKYQLIIGSIMLVFAGCFNPFAPTWEESEGASKGLISDQTDIEGVFKNFQYAYTFKDTTIYGGLLADNFVFVYRDYDNGYDVSWGRDEDVRITYALFNSVQKIDLIWNNIVSSSIDSSQAIIIRGFNLTFTFNPTDIIRVDGRVNLTLEKNKATNKWLITRWRDESNF